MHDEEHSGRPSIIMDDLVRERIMENRQCIGSPCKTKFKQTLSDVHCFLALVDFLTRGETVNAQDHCKTLQKL